MFWLNLISLGSINHNPNIWLCFAVYCLSQNQCKVLFVYFKRQSGRVGVAKSHSPKTSWRLVFEIVDAFNLNRQHTLQSEQRRTDPWSVIHQKCLADLWSVNTSLWWVITFWPWRIRHGHECSKIDEYDRRLMSILNDFFFTKKST